MPKSLKANFAYSLILTLCNYLFPLITYPYVSRVLGVDKIGVCNFVDGIINYFILFSMLGVSAFGVREIAKCKGNQKKINEIFSNIFLINALLTIIAVIALFVCSLYLSHLQPYREFLFFGVIKLVFNLFLIEWFFRGLQEFRYITIRSVIVRFVYVVLIFLFIRSDKDVVLYYGITTSTIVMNSILNWSYSRKFKSFSLSDINIKKYVKPILVFGYYMILTSMYTTFNIVFLGFVTNDIQVGFFATATKLYSILMGVFSAFTSVMVPKVSELLSDGDYEKLHSIANKTFSTLIMVATPIIVTCLFCAEDIVYLLAGPGYEGACTPFRIVIFLLIIIGMEQIVIQQFLMASSSNKAVFFVSSIGAIVGISINLLITPHQGAVGSAIAWGVSEFSVLLVGLHLIKKIMGIRLHLNILLKNVPIGLAYAAIPSICLFSFDMPYISNILLICIGNVLVFFFINIKIMKNEMLMAMVSRVKKVKR